MRTLTSCRAACAALILLLISVSGCSEQKRTGLTQPTAAAVAPVAKAPPDPKMEEFKKRVNAFAEEAQSFTRLFDQRPTVRDIVKKRDAVIDACTRIPDAPAMHPELESVREIARDICATCDTTIAAMQLGERSLREFNLVEHYDKCLESCRKLAETQRQGLTRIEAVLAQSPQPPLP